MKQPRRPQQPASSALRPAASLAARLGEPVDGASLATFRMAFGAILLWEVGRYFTYGWIARYFIAPRFHFTYFGFGWVHPWPAAGMYVHFALLGAAAICVALGLWYRVAAWLLWLCFTYVFLLEEARYLNHFYAASLFAFLLAVVPAHRAFSLDALRSRRGDPAAPYVPRWALWLVRAQVGIIYVFGGIAKLNPDWLQGEPMRSWLVERSDNPVIALIVRNSAELYVFSFGGLLFDLLVVPALLWKRTRPFAFVAAIVFHVINSQLFAIGMFPWMMIAASTLFFEPDWPRRVLARLRGSGKTPANEATTDVRMATPTRLQPAAVAFLALYLALQVLVPLRHLAYAGDVAWTEEGHRFSWRMKLRDKRGSVLFYVTEPRTGATAAVDPESVLTDWQAAKMASRPDMILQFAHYLADDALRHGRRVEVRARAVLSLNGHESRALVDPTVDLAAERRTLWPARWIIRGAETE